MPFFKKQKPISPIEDILQLKHELESFVNRVEDIEASLKELTHSVQEKSDFDLLEKKANESFGMQEKNWEKGEKLSKEIQELIQLKINNEELNAQASILKLNMAAYNAVVEMELKDANSSIKMVNKFIFEFKELQEQTSYLVEVIPEMKNDLEAFRKILELAEKKYNMT